jgi:protoheme IX farnesyltransferase
LIQLAHLPVWVLLATVLLGAVFTFQLFALKENSENYDKIAAGIFHWSITYLSLFSVLLVIAQLVSA